MSPNYSNPALDAELAYRRELLQDATRTSRPRRGAWFRNRRRLPLTRVTSAPVLSQARATIDGVPRWDDAPMVGRAEELARLMAHVDRAAGGRSSSVLLGGDAGVGKTRLIDELTARASDAGRPRPHRALRRPRRRRPALPAVRRPAAAGGRRSRAGAGLRRQPGAGRPAGRAPDRRAPGAAGGRGRRAGAPAATSRRAPAVRRRPAAAVRVGREPALRAGRRRSPLLVVLEDLHWADRSSRDLLRYLLARLVDEPVTIVASYRSDDLHRRHPLRPLLAELVRLPAVERIELAPLDDADVGALVRGLAAREGGLSQSAVDDVVARAEGNAFYAEELVAAGPAGRGAPAGADRRPAGPRGAALTGRAAGAADRRGGRSPRAPRAGRRGRRAGHRRTGAGAGRGRAPPPARRLRRRALPVPARAAARGRARRPAARGAGAAARRRRRLPGAAPRAPVRRPSARTTPARATTCPLRSAPSLEAAEDACRWARPPSSCSSWKRPSRSGRRSPTPRERAGRDQPALLLETAAVARTVGELHRAVALLRAALDVLGRGRRPRGPGAGALHAGAGPGPGRGRRRRAPPRAAPRWRWSRPSRRREVRTWAAATHARMSYAVGRWPRATRPPRRRSRPPTRSGWTARGPTPPCRWPAPGRTRDPAAVQAPARRGARPGPPLRRPRRRDAGAVQPGDRRVRGRPDRARRSTGPGGPPGGRGIWGSSGRSTPPSCGTCRSTRCTWLGDWDASLAEADLLSRVPEMAAHVRAVGLLVLVGRGDPAARERLAWARALAAAADASTCCSAMVTAAAEIDLAAWDGDPATAVEVAAATPAGWRSCGPTTSSPCCGWWARRWRRRPTRPPPRGWSATTAGSTAGWRTGEPLVGSRRSAVDAFHAPVR